MHVCVSICECVCVCVCVFEGACMSECACVSESVCTQAVCVCVCVFEPSGAESRRGIDRSRATGLSVRVSNTCVCVRVGQYEYNYVCVFGRGQRVCVPAWSR